MRLCGTLRRGPVVARGPPPPNPYFTRSCALRPVPRSPWLVLLGMFRSIFVL